MKELSETPKFTKLTATSVPKINGLLTLLYKIECPFGQIGHKLKPGKSWFHLSLRQGGVGEGVPGNARTLRGCLVLHHPLIMLASTVIATIYQGLSPQPLNHACRASSSLEPTYARCGPSLSPWEIIQQLQGCTKAWKTLRLSRSHLSSKSWQNL